MTRVASTTERLTAAIYRQPMTGGAFVRRRMMVLPSFLLWAGESQHAQESLTVKSSSLERHGDWRMAARFGHWPGPPGDELHEVCKFWVSRTEQFWGPLVLDEILMRAAKESMCSQEVS